MKKNKDLDLNLSIPFLLMHFTPLLIFFVEFSWWMPVICFLSYFIRMFGITAGYHRYFSHRTYQMNRFFQFLMAALGSTAFQKGVLWWAANHRHHHRFSDQPEDLHSPKQNGIFWAHIGWILSSKHVHTDWKKIQDLAQFPELVFLNRYHWLPGILYAVFIYGVFGFSGLVWGFFLSTVLLWHGTFLINSATHLWGRRRYHTKDDSRNSWILAILTLGEGWHNNHHCFPGSTRQGFFWWELDISYLVLKGFSYLGVVHGMRNPPILALERKKIGIKQEDRFMSSVASVSNRQVLQGQ